MATSALIQKVETVEKYAKENKVTYAQACKVFDLKPKTFYTLKKRGKPRISDKDKQKVIDTVKNLIEKKHIGIVEACSELGYTKNQINRYKNDLRQLDSICLPGLTEDDFFQLAKEADDADLPYSPYFESKGYKFAYYKRKYDLDNALTRKPSVYSKRLVQQIWEDKNGGLCWDDILERYGVHRSAVIRANKLFGYGFTFDRPKNNRKNYPPKEIVKEAIIYWNQNNCIWKEVENKFKITRRTLDIATKLYELNPDEGKEEYIKNIKEAITYWRQNNFNMGDVCLKYKIMPVTLRYYAKKFNIL